MTDFLHYLGYDGGKVPHYHDGLKAAYFITWDMTASIPHSNQIVYLHEQVLLIFSIGLIILLHFKPFIIYYTLVILIYVSLLSNFSQSVGPEHDVNVSIVLYYSLYA